MALAGLAQHGRVLVAGDDKQLPPVRPVQEQEIEGKRLGGSLYDFLKSAGVVELPLDETFRLNAPLSHFPEVKFYPNRYRSADTVAGSRLLLRPNWEDGLEGWEKAALDPENPICVLLHEGPTSGTSNSFEAGVAARLVKALHARLLPDVGEVDLSADTFWQKRLAVISPHRAQNASIRSKLANHVAGESCVIETVDRIQGKERDAIVASYTVSDPEFALAEAEFIFSTERLNVTITRARTKLIFLISRRLLDVAPSEEEILDSAQILREFVFDTQEIGRVELDDGEGRRVPVSIRVRGFNIEAKPLEQVEPKQSAQPSPVLGPELIDLLNGIKKLSLRSQYGSALVSHLKSWSSWVTCA
jgi:superfamily I DNA and/or RNA helicase